MYEFKWLCSALGLDFDDLLLVLGLMHAVHIESSFVYPSIRDRRAVGLMWARRRCHSRDSEIVRGFRVVFVRGTVVGGP